MRGEVPGLGGGEARCCAQARPRVQGGRLSAAVFFVSVCVRVRVAVVSFRFVLFCFSVSTGELKYGDVGDAFVHVEKAPVDRCPRGGEPVPAQPPRRGRPRTQGLTRQQRLWEGYSDRVGASKEKTLKSYFISSEQF